MEECTTKFNEKFPMAHFTKQQLQDKEKDLKGSYKAISGAKSESGIGWNESMGMIIADPDQWLKCTKKYPKIKKHRKNGFPLFRSCEVLYEGSIATGVLSFTSTGPVEPVHNLCHEDLERTASESRGHIEANAVNPVSASVGGHEASEVEAQSVPSGTSSRPESGRKRKQSQIAAVLDGYLGHKKIQSEKTVEALLEKRAQEEEYSVEKCLDTADAMEELTDDEKATAAEVFENDMNKQMFMKQKNLNVRLIWLRRKISRLASV